MGLLDKAGQLESLDGGLVGDDEGLAALPVQHSDKGRHLETALRSPRFLGRVTLFARGQHVLGEGMDYLRDPLVWGLDLDPSGDLHGWPEGAQEVLIEVRVDQERWDTPRAADALAARQKQGQSTLLCAGQADPARSLIVFAAQQVSDAIPQHRHSAQCLVVSALTPVTARGLAPPLSLASSPPCLAVEPHSLKRRLCYRPQRLAYKGALETLADVLQALALDAQRLGEDAAVECVKGDQGGVNKTRHPRRLVHDHAAPSKPRRFFGSVEIDMVRPVKSFDAILNAVVMELQRTKGAKVRLTLEIEADAEGGFAENDVGIVCDNARQLKFTPGSTGFEE